ncbi:pentapeptide repeat-containing protein [Nocardia sp. R7R-8]|uniref:pentapeptide repeat-containing protein n=1 Tax=Nocardia sp. R7R-8 TaxID=3459304 RepID=UPI00403D993E
MFDERIPEQLVANHPISQGKVVWGSMSSNYGRSRESVIGWPNDTTARETLERYLDKLSAEPESYLSEESILAADGLGFAGSDLSGLQLQEAALNEADLSSIRAVEADLYRAWMLSAKVRHADLSGSDLRKAEGRGCDAFGATFRNSRLQGAVFEDSDFRQADLRGADLRDASFAGADLRDADLRYCLFASTDFTKSKLGGSELEGAKGMILGPIDIGAASPHTLAGDELRTWFATRGAPDVEVYAPAQT